MNCTRISCRSVPAVMGIAFVLVACSSGFGRSDVAASFAKSYPDATSTQADCVAGRLLDRYDVEELEQQLLAPELEPEFEEAQFRDMFACGMDGDVRTQLEEQLIDSGVEADDAPCVADELSGDLTDEDIGVLLSGEITEDFYDKFFEAMSGCDAINSTE